MARDSVLVTGSSTGIGRACALYLSRNGFRVFAGVRKQADGESLQGEASAIEPVILDVTNSEQIAQVADLIKQETTAEGLSGLVNNAGIPVAGPLEFIPLAELRRVLEVNVVGQIAMTQAMLPMLRAARGRVVNIGSIAGRISTPFTGPYSASKFAMEALTDSLRTELQPWGIEVSIVEPGNISTNIWQRGIEWGKQMRSSLPPEAEDFYGSNLDSLIDGAEYMERSGIPPERVAKAVVHALTAAKPKTRYVVGIDARAQKIIARLPDRLRDRLVKKALADYAKRGRKGSS